MAPQKLSDFAEKLLLMLRWESSGDGEPIGASEVTDKMGWTRQETVNAFVELIVGGLVEVSATAHV